ncbi:hypothetical protein C0J52_21485, partial [Blattella germanica]
NTSKTDKSGVSNAVSSFREQACSIGNQTEEGSIKSGGTMQNWESQVLAYADELVLFSKSIHITRKFPSVGTGNQKSGIISKYHENKVTILVKNTSKTCLQLSKMPPKRVKFSDYDKIASLIDSVFDSENDESDINSDNESIDDNTTSKSSSSNAENANLYSLKLISFVALYTEDTDTSVSWANFERDLLGEFSKRSQFQWKFLQFQMANWKAEAVLLSLTAGLHYWPVQSAVSDYDLQDAD